MKGRDQSVSSVLLPSCCTALEQITCSGLLCGYINTAFQHNLVDTVQKKISNLMENNQETLLEFNKQDENLIK